MERKSEDVPLLIAMEGPLQGQRWAVRGSLLIGREPSCDLVIADRQVSRRHARLRTTSDGVLLEDLGSKNGTNYNGIPLTEPVILQDGDSIQIALAQRFTFISSDATLPIEGEEIESLSAVGLLLRVDKRGHRVWIGDQEVLPPLSLAQFKLLELLYENQGQVVPRPQVIEWVWGSEEAILVTEQALDALVRRLRERLASIEPNHMFIETVRGHGLRLNNPRQS